MNAKKIAVIPKVHGLGGMVSFQSRFISGLEARGFMVTQDIHDPEITAVLIIGGTRKIKDLLISRKRGVRIVQRLNGMNWLHRVRRTPFRRYIRAETNNWVLAFIRRFVANRIVYQSDFSQWWWNKQYGRISKPQSIVLNGVDLLKYAPSSEIEPPQNIIRILMLEGHMGGSYSIGLNTGFELACQVKELTGKLTELLIAGDVPEKLQGSFTLPRNVSLKFMGVIPGTKVPEITQQAHMLFSADLNAACPNAVVESLACGLPVISFDTGALVEMVPEYAGIVVPYGSNHWKLQKPDIPALGLAAQKVFENNKAFRLGACRAAEEKFDVENMLDKYLDMLLG
jgi:glycosyltransferase involved in cell wall biosynthesis